MEFKQSNNMNAMKKMINSFKYAGIGFFTAFKEERNMKFHVLAMILVIILGFVFDIDVIEWIVCIVLFAGVIAGEMFNTAIENVVDMITLEKNDKAKIIKDVAAGGVLIWAIGAAIIGCLIFIPKIFG